MDAEVRFDDIAADLQARDGDVVLTQMMGMPSLKRNGKLFAGFARDEDAMVFKLTDAAARERALALDGAHLFDPSGRRPMKEWVVVPLAHAQAWAQLAEAALP